jgi:hypothetical protein
MYPMQSNCDHELAAGSYTQTSLNHWKPFVPPKLSRVREGAVSVVTAELTGTSYH